MLPYINTLKPEFTLPAPDRQIKKRLQSAALVVPTLVAGAADVALGALSAIPAFGGEILGFKSTIFHGAFAHGIEAFQRTPQRVFENALRAMNPVGLEPQEKLDKNSKKAHPLLLKMVSDLGDITRKMAKSPNRFMAELGARCMGLATLVTLVAAANLEQYATVLLAAASLLTLGQFSTLNAYAYTNLDLTPYIPTLIVSPALVVYPKAFVDDVNP